MKPSPHTQRWRVALWLGVAAILTTPLVAMRFTHEVDWSIGDFGVAAMLLVGAGTAIEWIVRTGFGTDRIVLVAAVLGVTALVWAQGAVGLFG